MYFTKNIYEKVATYMDVDSMVFFMKKFIEAERQLEKGIKVDKENQEVVFSSSVRGFDPKTDARVPRVELNMRGVLRDFVGIDWDFEKRDDFLKMQDACMRLSESMNTVVLFYPSFSFPEKPRCRTVFFTQKMMTSEQYVRAVKWFSNFTDCEIDDDTTWNIKHNFNLMNFNTEKSREYAHFFCRGKAINRLLDNEENQRLVLSSANPLPDTVWEDIELDEKELGFSKQFDKKNLKHHQVHRLEHKERSWDDVMELTEKLVKRVKIDSDRGDGICDFGRYYNFMQFLHSLARAEYLGGLSHEQVIYVLKKVACGNHKWENDNIFNYNNEYSRVSNSEEKLLIARPISFYLNSMN